LIHKDAEKRAMILAQNKLQPQEEIDENGYCGRLPIRSRCQLLSGWAIDTPTAPRRVLRILLITSHFERGMRGPLASRVCGAAEFVALTATASMKSAGRRPFARSTY